MRVVYFSRRTDLVRRRPLLLRKRTLIRAVGMSAKCQKRTWVRFQHPLAFSLAISNIALADQANPTLEALSQFGLMRPDELVEKRALMRLQAWLAENLEPDRKSSAAEPSAALEEAHMALIIRRGVHDHDLLIVATQRGEIGTD